MARQVVWTVPAVDDLQAAADYIGKDSPHYSATVVRSAFQAAKSLRQFALRGHVVPELADEAIRELFVGRYRLIYKVGSQRVLLLGFIHGSRDLAALWKSRE